MGIDTQQTLTQPVPPRIGSRSQTLPILDRSGCANPFAKQPRLVVKSLRIKQPSRLFQFHGQTPALPAVNGRPVLPAHPNRARQISSTRHRAPDFKSNVRRSALRQTCHLPLNPQGTPVEGIRQAVIQRRLPLYARPHQPQQAQSKRVRAKKQQAKPQAEQQHPAPHRRQYRQITQRHQAQRQP